MAYYAALVPLVQLLEEIIHDDHNRYPDFNELGKQQITKTLHEKFTLVQKSLDDYYSSNGDRHNDILERRIITVAYRAQDIIEPQLSQSKPHIVQKFVCLLISVMCPKCRPDQDVYDNQDLKRVEEEVDSILDELATRIKESVDFSARSKSEVDYDIVDVASGGSKQGPGGTMVGFDEHVTVIKEQLCGGSSELQTVPIIGMGGIGKTTLALNIFNDKLVVNYFDVLIWVTVSQDYRIENIFQAILDSTSASKETRELKGEKLAVYVHKYLMERRYLIVLDDIWSTNVLDDVKRICPDCDNGSRIMLTTRLSDVAAYDSTLSSVHQMEFLNEEQSWDLFREKVFAQGQYCPPELEDLGKSIVRSCRGLPLAIVVIAGVLSKAKRTRSDWHVIVRNVNSSVVTNKNDEHLSRILSLSYNHLPHHLKSCFLYIGGFPEDHEILVSNLIKLWMAEGFLTNPVVEESSKRRSLEEVGEEYLEELVKRNLILITKKKYNGKIEVCGIHDLLRDLCQQRARDENFFHFGDVYGNLPEDRENVRRVCLHPTYVHQSRTSKLSLAAPADSSVRSIFSLEKYARTIRIPLEFKLLRVIDALKIEFPSFPNNLLKLIHLRYLALYLCRFSYSTKKLTVSPLISQLQNLQTFIVTLSYGVDLWLPSEMWNMQQLRHVVIDRLAKLPIPCDPARLMVLENLQTLTKVVNFRFTEEAVAMIPNLKILAVAYTERENAKWDSLNNLANLLQLEELDIDLDYNGDDFFPTNNFAFPPNLKRLSLTGCYVPWKKMSIVGCLSNLEALELKLYDRTIEQELYSDREVWEPKEGEFLKLKVLKIQGVYIEHWRADDTHFPCLEQLHIKKCQQLDEIPLGIGDIPTLQLLDVQECSDSVTNSARRIQEEQESMGNDTLQVRYQYPKRIVTKTKVYEIKTVTKTRPRITLQERRILAWYLEKK